MGAKEQVPERGVASRLHHIPELGSTMLSLTEFQNPVLFLLCSSSGGGSGSHASARPIHWPDMADLPDRTRSWDPFLLSSQPFIGTQDYWQYQDQPATQVRGA